MVWHGFVPQLQRLPLFLITLKKLLNVGVAWHACLSVFPGHAQWPSCAKCATINGLLDEKSLKNTQFDYFDYIANQMTERKTSRNK